MRVSSCVLLCLLSASLVSSITILDVPKSVNNDENSSVKLMYDDNTDITLPETESSRRLLVSINKKANKVSSSPPPPPPPPEPKKEPKKEPKQEPKKEPKQEPKQEPKKEPKQEPKQEPKKEPKQEPRTVTISANVAKTETVATSSLAKVPVFFTCDNEFEMFVNGNKVGSGSSWTTTYHFSFQVKEGDVIAIDGVDKGGPAAFIGVFGGKPTKPADWRCSTKETAGWKLNSFDDSSWSKPVSYGRNQDNNIWRSVGSGSRPNIPADAEWLWTNNNENHDRVYCRYFMTPVAAPVAAPVVRVIPQSVPAPAPVAAPVPTPVPAPSATTKQSVIDEIIRDKEKANTKLTKFQEKLLALLKENSDEQLKLETENRNNYNGVSVTLKNEQLRLEAARVHMKKLYDETQNLNSTIQKHYKKLIADTDYLQSLDEMRPAFLKSLDELASHIQNVKTIVDNKIVKDEYKDEMVRLLTGIHFNTHNISGYVATAFINHYNKYKALIQKENTDYSNELKRLTQLSNEYKIQVQLSADIEKERARLEGILLKLKDTLQLSISQREEFDLLVKEVVAIFDKKRC